jgi:polyferredoxin
LLKKLIFVAYFLEVGLLLVLVPWSVFWERNYFAESRPLLQQLLRNNFLRGAVSGLGVVNLLTGLNGLADALMARRLGDTVSRSDGSSVSAS